MGKFSVLFLKDESGATAIEYGLIAGLIGRRDHRRIDHFLAATLGPSSTRSLIICPDSHPRYGSVGQRRPPARKSLAAFQFKTMLTRIPLSVLFHLRQRCSRPSTLLLTMAL